MIEMGSRRRSARSALAAQHDDDIFLYYQKPSQLMIGTILFLDFLSSISFVFDVCCNLTKDY